MEVQKYGGKPYDRFYDTMVRWEAARAIRWRRIDIQFAATNAQIARSDAQIARSDAQLALMDAQIARSDARLDLIVTQLDEQKAAIADLCKRVESLERSYFYRPVRIFRCRPATKPSQSHTKAAPRSYRRQLRNKKLGRWC